MNANLFSNLYARTKSYSDENEFSSAGHPASDAERAPFVPFPDAVRADILEGRWSPPVHGGSAGDRLIAQRAKNSLGASGYAVKDSVLVKDRVPVQFEIMVRNRVEERWR
jgi:peptide/nickel transport system substrate-binding protein